MSSMLLKLAPLLIILSTLTACKSTLDPRDITADDMVYQEPISEKTQTKTNIYVDPNTFVRVDLSEKNASLDQQHSFFKIERYKRGDEYLDKISLPSNLLFDYNASKLSPQNKDALDNLMSAYQDALAQQFIYIVGHTDSDGDPAYNIGLSTRRAVSVAKLLGQYELPNDRMLLIPAGEHLPALPNTSRANKAANRRVELFLAKNSLLTIDYIKQQSCPEQLCQYAEVSVLEVNRRFELKTERDNSYIPTTVITMEKEYQTKRNQTNVTIREANFYTIEIRPNLELKIQTRQINNLPAEYHIQGDDNDRALISERM